MAIFFRDGIVVKKDNKEAYKLFEAAAKQHLSNALCNLADCHLAEYHQQIPSITNDLIKAISLYKEAAAQKHAHSLLRLGELYEQDPHFSPGLLTAYEYYQESADLGDEAALAKVKGLQGLKKLNACLEQTLPQLPQTLTGIILDYTGSAQL